MNRICYALLLIVSCVAASAAEITLSEAQLANARLTYAAVETRDVHAELTLSGELMPDRRTSYRVTPIVDGIVTELLAIRNDTVNPGQVLARLRSQSLGQAQADYIEALVRFELAAAERNRIEGLWKDQIVAESRWLAVESEYKSARATLDNRRRLLRLVGLTNAEVEALARQPEQLARFELIAPSAGVITEVTVEPGQFLAAGQVAFHIDDLSALWAEVRIPVADLPKITLETAARVRVDANPGHDYSGRLLSLGGEVERQSQTLGGRIAVDNADGILRPGMFATVVLDGIPQRSLAVPASAVFQIGEQSYVFEVVGPRQFVLRPVEIGAPADGWIPVHGGVAEQARIVSGGVAELKSHWQYQGGE